MFLLIPLGIRLTLLLIHPLHSNMFLLILRSVSLALLSESSFTFQYVSINTQAEWLVLPTKGALHSNMFLLIHVQNPLLSIVSLIPLHSNMFLLIRVSSTGFYSANISLHSNMFLLIPALVISSYCVVISLHSNMFLLIPAWIQEDKTNVDLYIPICFY